MRRMHFLLLMLAGASVPAALGHPSYFHDRNIAHTCTEHPTRPAGNHISPINDQDITVKASQHGQFLKEVCPGETYKLTVSFGEQERAALVTVSGGTLQEANVAGCTNAVTTKGNEMVTTMNAHWEVPCSLLGRVEVKVTTATGFTGPWLKGSSGFTILPVSKCPGYNKCKADSLNPPAARSHAASPTTDFPSKPKINETALGSNPDGEQDAAAGPLFFAVNQPVSLGGSLPNGLARGGRMCAPSSLGYQCSVNVAAGVNVHYSYGGPAPLNACTNKTTVERVARNASSLMHYAIETEQEAHSFRLTAQQAGGIKPAPGWAHGLGGVVRPKAGSKGSGVMTVCFSRPAVAKASMVPNLDPSMVPLIWSSHSKGHFVDRHDKDGSLIVNMLSGQHAVLNKHDSTAVKTNYVMHIAHASAMIAAFAVLMPLAGLVARHRWIFTPANEPYNSKAGGAWFPIHLFVQLLGCVAAIVSYVLAMLQWFGKHSLGFDRHLLYAPHCELGTGVMAMVGVQLLVGGLRFCMPPRWRSSWKMMHGLWGWATVGAGAANCLIGTFLMRDLLGMPWLTWLLPVVCPLGALMLGGMLLEVPRMRRVKEVCCWEDDEMSEPPTPTLKHVKSDAAVEISSRRSTAATTEATEAVSTVRRPAAAAPATLAVAPTAVSPVLAPVEGHTLTSSSPRRLTGSTPATIRTV